MNEFLFSKTQDEVVLCIILFSKPPFVAASNLGRYTAYLADDFKIFVVASRSLSIEVRFLVETGLFSVPVYYVMSPGG